VFSLECVPTKELVTCLVSTSLGCNNGERKSFGGGA
jgi:hypothetical protein